MKAGFVRWNCTSDGISARVELEARVKDCIWEKHMHCSKSAADRSRYIRSSMAAASMATAEHLVSGSRSHSLERVLESQGRLGKTLISNLAGVGPCNVQL